MKYKSAKNSSDNKSRRPRREKAAYGAQNAHGNKSDRNQSSPQEGRGGTRSRKRPSKLLLYGMHTVRAALANPARKKLKLFATENALERINIDPAVYASVEREIVEPAALYKMVGADAVHQGIVLDVAPLPPVGLEDMQQSSLILVLDQITDPHNVGAIMRTAVAMDAGAVVSTSRHSAQETGVLAKSASGAIDMIDHIQIGNLSRAIEQLSSQGYYCIGLDSEGPSPLEQSFALAPNNGTHIALVLGAEGQGLRKKTRETCDALARLDMPGAIKSLNVSNAAAISLYAARQHLDR